MRLSRRSLLGYSAALASVPIIGRGARAQEKPIRIGTLFDLSGPFAAAGSVASATGTQIAIDLTNERGGVLGKYKVEAVNADSQSKPDVGLNEAVRLVSQEKLDIIVGIYASATAVPVAAKMESEKKILWITTAVATSVVKNKNYQYIFRAQIHSDQYGEAGVGFIAELAKAKLGMEPKDVKVAIIYEDGPYGTGVADADEANCKAKGIPIVLKEAYSASAPDLSSLVTKLRRARPDVIYHVGYNPDITLFLRQSREAGLKFKMLIGNGAGYSQIDKLRETFKGDVDFFCNVDPVPAQLLDPKKLAPEMGGLIKIMIPPSGAAGRHPGGRHHSGLWRQVLPAGDADGRAERTLDPGGDAIHQGCDQRRLADRHPDRRPGAAASGLIALFDELRCCRSKACPSASGDSWRSTRFPSRCGKARSSGSSGRTAPARARPST